MTIGRSTAFRTSSWPVPERVWTSKDNFTTCVLWREQKHHCRVSPRENSLLFYADTHVTCLDASSAINTTHDSHDNNLLLLIPRCQRESLTDAVKVQCRSASWGRKLNVVLIYGKSQIPYILYLLVAKVQNIKSLKSSRTLSCSLSEDWRARPLWVSITCQQSAVHRTRHRIIVVQHPTVCRRCP